MTVTDAHAAPAPAGAAILREARRAELRAVAEDPLLKIEQVEAESGLSRATIDRRIKAGTFPPPIHSDGWRRWARSHLRAWKAAGAGWRSALPENPGT